MKKVLFASTALVAFAGAASAEVTLTGFAEMGIVNVDSFTAEVDELTGFTTRLASDGATSFFTDVDVTFTMSGETDGGLTFGASVDLDENGAFNGTTQGGETIFLSGAFGTLTAGDTDGALDWALTEVAFNSGSINDDETVHFGYNGNAGLDGLYDGQIVRYDYSFGDFGVALSAEIDDTDGEGNDDVFGIGVKYQLDLGGTDIGLGLGYQTAALGDVDLDTLGVSANTSFGSGFTVGLSYVTYENHLPGVSSDLSSTLDTEATGRVITDGQDTDHLGVGLGYTTGPISASINYGKYDHDAGVELEGIGLSLGYDLGGGAVVQLGYGRSEIDVNDDVLDFDTEFDDIETISFGVRMNF